MQSCSCSQSAFFIQHPPLHIHTATSRLLSLQKKRIWEECSYVSWFCKLECRFPWNLELELWRFGVSWALIFLTSVNKIQGCWIRLDTYWGQIHKIRGNLTYSALCILHCMVYSVCGSAYFDVFRAPDNVVFGNTCWLFSMCVCVKTNSGKALW